MLRSSCSPNLVAALAVVLLATAAGCGSVHETPSDCTAPCAGDPVDDFAQTQGGTNGRWKYLADTRAANGADYVELTWGELRGEPAWVGAVGASPPGILSCADNPAAAGCAGVETSLLFIPGTDQDPALAFVAESDGTYALTGKVRAATGDPEGLPQRFTISRNSRHDLIDSRVHVTAPVADDFTAEVELLAGDRLILAFPGGTNAVPVTFDYHLTFIANGASAFPGLCQLAVSFDGGNPLEDACRGGAIENLNDMIGPAGTSVAGPSVNPDHGDGRVLAEGQYLRSTGGPIDQTGDFTIQFWAQFASPQPSFDAIPFNDGGVGVAVNDTTVDFCYFWGVASDCMPATRPPSGWHFYRITRAVSEAAIEICIDGQSVLTDPNPGTADMTSDVPVYMGRDLEAHPAYFAGTLDEIRAFKRALPCPTP